MGCLPTLISITSGLKIGSWPYDLETRGHIKVINACFSLPLFPIGIVVCHNWNKGCGFDPPVQCPYFSSQLSICYNQGITKVFVSGYMLLFGTVSFMFPPLLPNHAFSLNMVHPLRPLSFK